MTRRVLVVDDDARVRTALCGLLASTADLTVASAPTTAEGWTAAERDGSFDVAVVDILLPDPATGLTIIRRLARRVPVLAISVTGAHRADALAAGAAAFLDKDGHPDVLLAALRGAIGPG
jgi:DNA-binding NarL/FixJ family response regulator